MSTVVRLPGAVAALVPDPEAVPGAIASLGLPASRPVLAMVGGAGGLTDDVTRILGAVFTDVIAPAIRTHQAVAVDGGTDAGVMRLLGRSRAAGFPFPLVGVAAVGTVTFPGHVGANPDAAPLDRHHSHFVLAPGDTWGDEAPYLAAVVSHLAAGRPSVTVLANGGEIALTDAEHSLAQGRPVLILAGTGRAADTLATAAADPARCRDERLAAIAASPLVRVVDVTDRTAVAAELDDLLSG
ncbi:hypothetical protein [Paractinoplanes brasiliensis]|uniref:LSDAT prokaryote domain-containing protein n=2 Tax=Paractinoplanes brasiliensis TaxID=52695 RepID=A0A4R6K559_9ACTN|nr:hypothetical protein [Actinoplanes brasiliensis]TDO42385.1 hypothetical protein C8E87_6155 [Actinoplanes brasiliensis]GID29618.1 hypothetical protein Abr02nite_46010 [Actinoplanes brasiliensis]